MEEDEIKVEEPIVENEEELEKDVDYSNTPWYEKPESEWDTDDAAEAKKALKTAMAQKAHWKKKATQVKPEPEVKKPEEKKEKQPESKKNINSEQISSSEIVEMSRLAARGYTDEEMELLKDIKNLKGLNNLTEAIESPLFKSHKEQKEIEAKKNKAQLPPSGGSRIFKEGQETTKDDLKNAWLGKK